MAYPITTMMISGLPKTAYRNGVGKYEGVVAHSTATPEAPAINIHNYEVRTWNTAFVHYVVDWTQIIYHADVNYKCYGAGATANQRYVSVELCETADPNKFNESYARYVFILAKILHDKGLGVTQFGSFWTHADISSKLGGTNHTDPVGYLSSHGKSIAQLIADVKSEYNKLSGATSFQKPAQANGTYPTGAIGFATIVPPALNVRDSYSVNSNVLGTVNAGEKYFVFKNVDGWYLIGNGMWISGGNEFSLFTARPAEQPAHLYRVRTTWDDAKSQLGAYANLDSAKALADQNKDHKVFDENGTMVYDPQPQPTPVQHMYRVRKDWADAKNQIGAFSNLDGAKSLADEHASEGYKVFDENGAVVYTPVVQPIPQPQPEPVQQPVEPAPQPQEPKVEPQPEPTPVEPVPVEPTPQPEPQPEPTPEVDPHEGHHDIMGESVVDFEKMVAFVKVVNPNAQDIEEIALNFIEIGRAYGIRGDMAFCQSIIETGYFKFDGGTAVTPDQHNYAGIGVTSKGMKGNSFAEVKDGVTAQIQHLFAYASKNEVPVGEEILDPRFKLVSRGVAPHFEDLNNRWAMNDHYGQDIVKLYEKLVNFEYTPPVKPVEDQQVSMIKKLIDYFFEKLAKLLGK